MTEPPAPPETPPESPPADDDLTGLDDRARRAVERANTEAAAFRHELMELRSAHEQLQRKHESEQERIVREAEQRGRAAAQAEHTETVQGYERALVTAAVEARAAGRFNDPADAVLNLSVDDLVAETDPRKRTDRIDKALTDLLTAKPYLARTGNGRPPVLVTQGPRSDERTGRPRDRERSWLRG